MSISGLCLFIQIVTTTRDERRKKIRVVSVEKISNVHNVVCDNCKLRGVFKKKNSDI